MLFRSWIRAQKGHLAEDAELRFKEGDALAFRLHAETTDRIVIFTTQGRAFTLKGDGIPRGRGDGQPLRLMVEMGNDDSPIALFKPSGRWLLAATDGKGFLIEATDMLAEKRTGRQVMTVEGTTRVAVCAPALGDMVAVSGSSRRLLVFPTDQLPVMARGRGVQLQAYKGEATLLDARVFTAAEGLSWQQGGRTRTESAILEWRGNRAAAGKAPPHGFPKNGRFA